MVVKLKNKKSQPAYLLVWVTNLSDEQVKVIEEKIKKLGVNAEVLWGFQSPTLVTFE